MKLKQSPLKRSQHVRNPQHILICGNRCLARAVVEIEDAVNTGFCDAIRLAGELADLESKLGRKESMALQRKRNALAEKNEDNADWQDTNGRKFGVVDWAPEISVGVDDRHYTRNITTFAVDGAKLGKFAGNIIYLGAFHSISPPHFIPISLANISLGNQYNASQPEDLFWPIATVRDGRTIPADLQLSIRHALSCRLVNNPDTEDKNGEPLYIVAKYSNTTKLTFRCVPFQRNRGVD